MLSSISAMAYAPAMAPTTVTRAAAPQMMDVAGLKEQATKLNPVVGFFDPLNLAEGEFADHRTSKWAQVFALVGAMLTGSKL